MQTSVETVTYLPYDAVAVTVVVILLACVAITTLVKAYESIKSLQKPKKSERKALQEKQTECAARFDADLKRIKVLEENQRKQQETDRVVLTALRAILSHEINGNSIERMRAANEEIDQMLINR